MAGWGGEIAKPDTDESVEALALRLYDVEAKHMLCRLWSEVKDRRHAEKSFLVRINGLLATRNDNAVAALRRVREEIRVNVQFGDKPLDLIDAEIKRIKKGTKRGQRD